MRITNLIICIIAVGIPYVGTWLSIFEVENKYKGLRYGYRDPSGDYIKFISPGYRDYINEMVWEYNLQKTLSMTLYRPLNLWL
jgi:hypothetical protein